MTKVESCGRTDVGKVRTHNEDNFLIADMSQDSIPSDPKQPVNFTVGKRGGLFVVSDGVGGAAAGEIASRLSITSIYDKLNQVLDEDANLSGNYFVNRMEEAISQANSVVHKKSRANPRWSGMAATITAALVHQETLSIGQIGDSRAYLIRGGEITQLTKDQSLVQQMIDLGKITEEEGKTFAKKNVILQALGVNSTVDVILSQYKLYCDDCLVLCTDGLHGLVSPEEIKSVIEKSPDLAQACESLIDTANARGGTDNITIIIARFSGASLAQPGVEDKIVYSKVKKSKTTQRTLIPVAAEAPSASEKPVVPRASRAPAQAKGSKIYLLAAIFFVTAMVLLMGITLWQKKKVRRGDSGVLEVKESLRELPKASQESKSMLEQKYSSDEKLESLMRNATLAFNEERFVPPQSNNAFEYCQQILELDPSNTRAISIKKDIASHFRTLAEESWQAADWKKAQAYYQNVLKVYPEDVEAKRRIKELERRNRLR